MATVMGSGGMTSGHAALQESDHASTETRIEAFPCGRIGYHAGPIERRAEHGRMSHLAAEAAAYAAIDDGGDRVQAQRVGIGRDGEGWAAGKPDTGVIAGAGIRIDTVT